MGVVRLNVNTLLLVVLLIESTAVGLWLFFAILFNPTVAVVADVGGSMEDAFKDLPVEIIKPDMSDRPDPNTLAIQSVVCCWLMFVFHLIGLTLAVLAYKKQCRKPLLIYLPWLIISSIAILGVLIYCIFQVNDITDRMANPPEIKLETPMGTVVLPKPKDPPPVIDLLRRIFLHLNWVLIPLVVLKGIAFLFSLFTTVLSLRFFARAVNQKGFNPECKESVKFIDEP